MCRCLVTSQSRIFSRQVQHQPSNFSWQDPDAQNVGKRDRPFRLRPGWQCLLSQTEMKQRERERWIYLTKKENIDIEVCHIH